VWRLDALRQEKPLDGIDEFIRASSYIDDDIAQEIQATLQR
jgi:hypothetical protein